MVLDVSMKAQDVDGTVSDKSNNSVEFSHTRVPLNMMNYLRNAIISTEEESEVLLIIDEK